jgi:DNA-binding protein YbaB
MIKVTGKIEYRAIALGAWALVSQEGKTYELQNPPSELQKDGLSVEVEGTVKEGIMTISMIGQVLEVRSFKILS